MRQTTYETKVKQKRGEGSGENYIPWIKVGEFSGIGSSSRVLGLKTKREHHFHSNFEASLFYIFDLDENIEDIREQFPLSEIDIAKEIAEEAGIRYPSNRDNETHVLTTDYLLSRKDGQKIAMTVKPLDKITKRQLELFEIERRYWNIKGVQWSLVTEEEMPGKDLLKNYKHMHSTYRRFLSDDLPDEHIAAIMHSIFENYNDSLELSLSEFGSIIDSELDIEAGSALGLIIVLVAKGCIEIDLTESLTSGNRKMKELIFKISDAKGISKSDLAA